VPNAPAAFLQKITLPEKPVEHVVFWGMLSQFVLYFAGLGPAMSVLIGAPLILVALVTVFREGIRPHWLALLWCACMCGLLIETLMAGEHKGIRGFGLAALVPIAGTVVRPAIVYRAAALLGIQTLFYSAAASVALLAHFEPHYHSLIPDPNFSQVTFSEPDTGVEEKGVHRLVAFTPYATVAGAVACVCAVLTLGEKRWFLALPGLAGWLALLWLTKARAAAVIGFFCIVLFHLLWFRRRYLFLAAGAGMLFVAIFFGELQRLTEDAQAYFHAKRASSSQVRHNLRTIAIGEWLHGPHDVLGSADSIPGGAVVAGMPIGTHDSLAANLFMRGSLGLSFVLLPLAVSLVFGFFRGFSSEHRIVASGATLLLLYSYAAALDVMYMFIWPLFLVIGAMRLQQPEPAPAQSA
jgi:hypothetical protein